MNIVSRLFCTQSMLSGPAFVFLLLVSNTAQAWIYSEHRDIAMQAVQNLDPVHRRIFDRFWLISRTGLEQRLCENVADLDQGLITECLDWAAFSAIAGDHSCSAKEMLDSVLTADWLLEVANVSAQLKDKLKNIPIENYRRNYGEFINNPGSIVEQINKQENRASRLNALRNADTKLLRADSQYATRANSNTAHFLIARPEPETTNLEYARLSLHSGSEINAMGVYAYYHILALKKASRLAYEPQLTEKQRRLITRAMLADEGFALHFLEDIFASGHVAGTWGDVTQRLGTHNYYNQHGLEAYTWEHEEFSVVLMGDANMRPQDMELAAKTISTSLRQVLDFAEGRDTGYEHPYEALVSDMPDDFNVCTQNQIPYVQNGEKYAPSLTEAIIKTPIPGLGDGFGSLPRFRSEVGPFIGLAGSIDGRVVEGGFLDFQDRTGSISGLDLSLRVGFGMDGVMDESGDGLVFASLGYRSDSASSNKFFDSAQTSQTGSISAAIPARSSIALRIRMPFYIIPGDLLWLSPLYLFNEKAYTDMAITAGNGGLIPWQQGMATSIGRFQFVLGREIGATFYGRNNSDQLIIPPDSPADTISLSRMESILFDFPIIEYRPYRSFSSNQSSSVVFQLFTSVDVPKRYEPVIMQGVAQSLDPVWSVGVRLVFDWRHY